MATLCPPSRSHARVRPVWTDAQESSFIDSDGKPAESSEAPSGWARVRMARRESNFATRPQPTADREEHSRSPDPGRRAFPGLEAQLELLRTVGVSENIRYSLGRRCSSDAKGAASCEGTVKFDSRSDSVEPGSTVAAVWERSLRPPLGTRRRRALTHDIGKTVQDMCSAAAIADTKSTEARSTSGEVCRPVGFRPCSECNLKPRTSRARLVGADETRATGRRVGSSKPPASCGGGAEGSSKVSSLRGSSIAPSIAPISEEPDEEPNAAPLTRRGLLEALKPGEEQPEPNSREGILLALRRRGEELESEAKEGFSTPRQALPRRRRTIGSLLAVHRSPIASTGVSSSRGAPIPSHPDRTFDHAILNQQVS